MATIAEQLTSLANTKTAIKDAIVAKGVTVADDTPFSGYATKIGEISGGGSTPATKYGVSIDSILGDVDENGELQKPTADTVVSFSGIKNIGREALQHKFYNNPVIKTVNFDSVTTIAYYGANYAFCNCKGITSVDLSSVVEISGNYGLAYAFQGCTGITSVDLSSLKSVTGNYSLGYTFADCNNLTSVDLSSLEYVAYSGALGAFKNTGIQKIFFPALTTVSSNSFGTTSSSSIFYGCIYLTEIHFRADMQATIEAMSQYANKWGATNATIYFDL